MKTYYAHVMKWKKLDPASPGNMNATALMGYLVDPQLIAEQFFDAAIYSAHLPNLVEVEQFTRDFAGTLALINKDEMSIILFGDLVTATNFKDSRELLPNWQSFLQTRAAFLAKIGVELLSVETMSFDADEVLTPVEALGLFEQQLASA